MDMMPVLLDAKAALPSMLRDGTPWNSLFVNYHKPFVKRLWRPWGEFRISLHCIHPCTREEALFHPHPWDSIVELVSGSYEMTLGHAPYGQSHQPPPVAATLTLNAGDIYQMTDPGSWHAVRPLNGPSYSLMISGKPRYREAIGRTLYPMKPAAAHRLHEFFCEIYDPQPK